MLLLFDVYTFHGERRFSVFPNSEKVKSTDGLSPAGIFPAALSIADAASKNTEQRPFKSSKIVVT